MVIRVSLYKPNLYLYKSYPDPFKNGLAGIAAHAACELDMGLRKRNVNLGDIEKLAKLLDLHNPLTPDDEISASSTIRQWKEFLVFAQQQLPPNETPQCILQTARDFSERLREASRRIIAGVRPEDHDEIAALRGLCVKLSQFAMAIEYSRHRCPSCGRSGHSCF